MRGGQPTPLLPVQEPMWTVIIVVLIVLLLIWLFGPTEDTMN
jgi:hypothetical protein